MPLLKIPPQSLISFGKSADAVVYTKVSMQKFNNKIEIIDKSVMVLTPM
jgi:hypothetical protein